MSVRHASRSVVDALPLSRPSAYICRHCRRNAHPSQIITQQRQYASDRNDTLPFAEKVRRKLWKGKPPGPENVDDLYGGPGAIETMLKERKERKARAQPVDELKESQASASIPQEDVQPVQPEREVTREMTMPGQTKAAKVEAREATEYEPASTWDDLPVLGHKGFWKEMPADPRDEYTPWLLSPIRTPWTFPELVSLMHQAIVECHMCLKMGVSLDKISGDVQGPFLAAQLERATINISTNGSIESANIIDPQSHQSLRGAIYKQRPAPDLDAVYTYEESEALIARTKPPMTPLDPRHLYTPSDTSFLDATLGTAPSHQTLKILKRFSILTNHPIPDPLLTALTSSNPTTNTLRTFLTSMAERTKAKPANVAEQILGDAALRGQPNLLVLGRRETPVDREKELGRWKVIEEELRARNLPVLGRLEVRR